MFKQCFQLRVAARYFTTRSDSICNAQAFKKQLMEDIKTCMRAKDTTRLSVLKSLKSDITYAEKAVLISPPSSSSSTATSMEVQPLDILRRAIRRREESVKSFTQAERIDLAQKEQNEIHMLQDYLPPPLSPQELKETIISYIQQPQVKEEMELLKSQRRKGWLMSKLVSHIDSAKASKKDIAECVNGILVELK